MPQSLFGARDGLLRYEWAADGIFEDRASTFAIRQEQPVPNFQVIECGHELEIQMHLGYDKSRFSASGFSAHVRGNITEWQSTWRYGTEPFDLEDRNTLYGTCKYGHTSSNITEVPDVRAIIDCRLAYLLVCVQ
ncbi:hypothetical protein V1517DRAFT_360390 [Lipomyces orientalis]|uniref:Uncharacterized protein n=1 Tax=Lipomyces orientalis TaxID=1233043 RepID=A0ACC3TC35_9ASCO